MGKHYEIVCDFFHDQAWPFAEHDSLPIIKVDYEGAAGRWTLYVGVGEEAEQVIVLSELPARAPVDRRPAMAELLSRANYRLNIGNFEMDCDGGEIRFRTSIDVDGTILDPTMVGTVVGGNLNVKTTPTPASPRCSKVARHPRTRSPESNAPNLLQHVRSCGADDVALRQLDVAGGRDGAGARRVRSMAVATRAGEAVRRAVARRARASSQMSHLLGS
jgi:hypothetical protein